MLENDDDVPGNTTVDFGTSDNNEGWYDDEGYVSDEIKARKNGLSNWCQVSQTSRRRKTVMYQKRFGVSFRKRSNKKICLLATKLDGIGEVVSELTEFTNLLKEKEVLEMKKEWLEIKHMKKKLQE